MLSVKMALRSIGANKLRAALTMLGIIIGVMALVVLVSLVDSATNSITEEVSTFVAQQANKKGYIFVGKPLVRFMVDPSLKSGRFAVFAENIDNPTLARLRKEEKAFLDAMDIFKARLAKVVSAIGDPDRVALVFRSGMLCLNDMQEILDRADRQGLDFMHSKNAYSFSDRKFPLSAEESFKVLDTSLGLWEEELHLNREKVMGGSTEDESLFKQAIKNLFISVPTGTP